MKLAPYVDNGTEYLDVTVNKDHKAGALRFSHEILVTFVKKDNEYVFNSAWHCGVSEMSWDQGEKDSFEETFPGLLDEMQRAIAMMR